MSLHFPNNEKGCYHRKSSSVFINIEQRYLSDVSSSEWLSAKSNVTFSSFICVESSSIGVIGLFKWSVELPKIMVEVFFI